VPIDWPSWFEIGSIDAWGGVTPKPTYGPDPQRLRLN
jgi:hypothetical protein